MNNENKLMDSDYLNSENIGIAFGNEIDGEYRVQNNNNNNTKKYRKICYIFFLIFCIVLIYAILCSFIFYVKYHSEPTQSQKIRSGENYNTDCKNFKCCYIGDIYNITLCKYNIVILTEPKYNHFDNSMFFSSVVSFIITFFSTVLISILFFYFKKKLNSDVLSPI